MMDDDVVDDTPAERELLRRLAELPLEAEPARDLWPELAARISPPAHPEAAIPPRLPRRGAFLLRIAAAVLLFVGGIVVGHLWTGDRGTPSAVRTRRGPLRAAVEVQRTGTAYVAALRVLAERGDGREEREQGREAALSTLYGAAHELVRLAPDDDGATRILQTVSTTRSAGSGPALFRPVRF